MGVGLGQVPHLPEGPGSSVQRRPDPQRQEDPGLFPKGEAGSWDHFKQGTEVIWFAC